MLTEANGIMIRFRLDGQERRLGDKQAPVVMFAHSLATKLEMWQPQIDALSERYQIMRYDIRGHGGSDILSGAYTFETLVEDAKGLIDQTGLAPVHFVGLSLGGMIGQLLAATYPELIASLTLCSTSFKTPPEMQPEWDERIALAKKIGMMAHVDSTIGRWFTPEFVAQHPDQVNPIREMINSTYEQGYVGCAEAVKTLDLEDKLASIKASTLVMVGEKDTAGAVSAAREMATRIAGARLEVLPSCSHLCSVEQAELFNQTLMRFVDEHAVSNSA